LIKQAKFRKRGIPIEDRKEGRRVLGILEGLRDFEGRKSVSGCFGMEEMRHKGNGTSKITAFDWGAL